MQKKCTKRWLSFILCMVLIVAMALITTGCNGNKDSNGGSADGQEALSQEQGQNDASADGQEDAAAGGQDDVSADGNVLGEGSRQFVLTVVDQDGSETAFEVHTDKESVGDALEELGLISGDQGEYGLYIKTVNGITVDYDTDGAYWAFYINGEYSMTGVSETPITEGESYSLKVEK